MKFEFDNNMPIYIQLVEQMKIYIISGHIKAGQRLPSVRELAIQTKVNPNTMQKALVELEELKFSEYTSLPSNQLLGCISGNSNLYP